MKIVHLCTCNFFIDGYSYQENMLPKYHVKLGHDVTVIASLVSFNKEGKACLLPSPSERMDDNGFKVIRLSYKKPMRINKILRRYQGFYEKLCNENPDIIFCHGVSLETTELVKYLKKHPQTKLFCDNHADYVNSVSTFLSKHVLHKIIWRYYAKKLEPYMSKCFGVTPMRCRFLKEMYHINENIIEFLPMGVDDEAIPQNRDMVRNSVRKELGISDDAFLIFTGGKIDKLKNTHVLIEAIKKINNPLIHIVICGVLAPEMEYLKKDFDCNVHYLGWCNAQRVMNCMVAADLACFPGTHSTLWEQAVGVGIPAIFKRWNEITHMDVNGNCKFIIGEDVVELQQEIENFTCEEYYKQIKRKATIAATSFLYSDIAKKAIEVF